MASSLNSIQEIEQDRAAVPVWATHEIVRLSSIHADFRALVERRDLRKVVIALAKENAPYNRLRVDITKGGTLCFDGGGQKDATWVVIPVPQTSNSNDVQNGRYVFLRSNARKNGGGGNMKHECYWWLSGNQGTLCSVEGTQVDAPPKEMLSNCTWHVMAVPPNITLDRLSLSTKQVTEETTVESTNKLTDEELSTFIKDGYVVRRSVAPMNLISSALSLINGRLGRGTKSGDDITRLGGDIANAPDVVALGRCPPVARLIAQLLGGADKIKTIDGCQVALRFPHTVDSLVAGGAACQSEVSGRSWHTDGLRQGKKHSFSLLVGVALSDTLLRNNQQCDESNLGNLWVWPGSHVTCHQLMRWPDGQVLRERDSKTTWDTAGRDGARDGQAADPGYRDEDGALPDFGPGTPLFLKAGDVVLAHSLLAHCGGPNLGCDIRYMLYFRVRHTDWPSMIDSKHFETDMWCDLEGTWKQLDR